MNKQRIPLSDNAVIPASLSQYGIHGMEEKQKATAQKKKERAEEHRNLKMRTLKCDKGYAAHQRRLISLRGQAKTDPNFFVEPESELLCLMTIVGIIELDPKPHKVNKPILDMLRCIQPYVT